MDYGTITLSKLVDLNTRSTDIHMLDKRPTALVRHVGFVSRVVLRKNAVRKQSALPIRPSFAAPDRTLTQR